MPYNPAKLTQEELEKAARWFRTLDAHFGQTYILLLAPGVELDQSRAQTLNQGGTARIVNQQVFLRWLYNTYRKEIEEEATHGQLGQHEQGS